MNLSFRKYCGLEVQVQGQWSSTMYAIHCLEKINPHAKHQKQKRNTYKSGHVLVIQTVIHLKAEVKVHGLRSPIIELSMLLLNDLHTFQISKAYLKGKQMTAWLLSHSTSNNATWRSVQGQRSPNMVPDTSPWNDLPRCQISKAYHKREKMYSPDTNLWYRK